MRKPSIPWTLFFRRLVMLACTWAVMVALTLWGAHWSPWFPSPPTSPPPAPTRKTVAASPARKPPVPLPSQPVQLNIPAINLSAPIEPVGTLPNGNLEVPAVNQWDGVGWYKQGPLPGQQGTAVIDGHLDRPGELPAVFWNLHQLQVGDEVQVAQANGKQLSFQVTEMDYYPPSQAPLQRIFANQSGTNLNLITCAGTWIPSEQQTTLRLVVYTVLRG